MFLSSRQAWPPNICSCDFAMLHVKFMSKFHRKPWGVHEVPCEMGVVSQMFISAYSAHVHRKPWGVFFT